MDDGRASGLRRSRFARHHTGNFSEGAERDHAAVAASTGSFSDGDLAMHTAHERSGANDGPDGALSRARWTSGIP